MLTKILNLNHSCTSKNLFSSLHTNKVDTKSVVSRDIVHACGVRKRAGTINVRPFRPLAFLGRRCHRLIGNVIYIANI